MWNPIRNIIAVFLLFLAFGIVQKCLFVAIYQSLLDAGISDALWGAIRHGFAMDCSVAAYLTAIPALISLSAAWLHSRHTDTAMRIYFAIAATLQAAITVVDLTLYSYWGFRLDATPIFYFTTSPAAAMASAPWWMALCGILATAALAWALYKALSAIIRTHHASTTTRQQTATSAAIVAICGILFILIRGGVTVSTMNMSHCYYSSNPRLNHAAVNPAFSLLYSLSHQTDFGTQYRFMPDSRALALLDSLNRPIDSAAGRISITDVDRPDIYLIILESFSAHLMPSLGGEDIASNLDSLAREGILFSNFYASSFRTDRALPAILSAFPAQPSTSIMKFTDKIEHMPGMAAELRDAGYSTKYYYGGDANFTNMKAYLVSSGFDSIVSDADFPIFEKTGKWGAHDHLVFNRALADAKSRVDDKPTFTVIQTSSSHEPFEVPFADPRFSDQPRKNAFAYTDSCLMAFIDGLRALPQFGRTLVAIVPDHLGAWPQNLSDPVARHHIPFIIAGGALNTSGEIFDAPGSQTDIAATLIAIAGRTADRFTFSHDLLDPAAPRYAFFSEPSLAGMVTVDGAAVINCDSPQLQSDSLSALTAAYLQYLYTTIDKL